MILVNNTATKPCLLPFTEPWTSQRRRAKNNFVLKQVIPKTLTIHVKVLRTDLFQNGKVQWTYKLYNRYILYRIIIISARIYIWTEWENTYPRVYLMNMHLHLFVNLQKPCFKTGYLCKSLFPHPRASEKLNSIHLWQNQINLLCLIQIGFRTWKT